MIQFINSDICNIQTISYYQMEQAFALTGVDVSFEPQNKKTEMYELIRSFTPGDFLTIKAGFELYEKSIVNVDQFVGILMDILHKNQNWNAMGGEIITLIELFSYIDYQNKQKIKFEDFTNFVIQNEGIFAQEENFDEYKVVLSKQLNQHDIQASKVFALEGSQLLGALDPSQKSLKLLSTRKLENHSVIQLGSAAIINTVYSKRHNSLIISTNDKYLNFYNIQQTKLVRRFIVPDTQAFLIVSQDRQLLFAGTPSGKLYTWSLKQIFSDGKVTLAPNEVYKKYQVRQPIKEQQDLTCMIQVPTSDLIITGSNDCLIRLYQVRDYSLTLLKKLQCHPKGIKCLAYSAYHKIIVSCAFDFDVLVWNAYLQYPIAKLVGHEESLNSVYCPKNHPVILSLDSKGIMKIWNIKSFQLLQTISTTDGLAYKKLWVNKAGQVPSKGEDINKSSINFVYKQQFDSGIVCLKKMFFYEFVVNHDPKLTDDNQLVAFVYSPLNLEIYIGSEKDFRVWSVNKGVLARQFKKRTTKNIVSICLDKNHRRAFLGTLQGQIVSLNVFTGAVLSKYCDHTKEISFLGYSEKNNLLISEGWEGQIKIHNDTDHLERIDKRGNVLRNIRNCHTQDLIMGAYSDTLMLVASAARSPQCCIWDFEKGFFQKDFIISQEISCISFLDPYPLIVLGDLKGAVYIYIVKYHKKEGQLLLHWNNMYSIQKQAQVTVISSDFYKGELTVTMGDEFGYVRVLKLQTALTAEGLVPITSQIIGNKNPYRIEDYQFTPPSHVFKSLQKLCPLQPQKSIRTALQIKAHNQRVVQTVIVRETNSFCLLTAGDKLCKLWNQQGQNIGVLRQGYIQNPNWKFLLNSGYRTKQQNLYQRVMKNLSKIKDELKYLRRQKMIPFSSMDEDYQNMQHVDNNQIYKDLKQIEDYLRKSNPKSSKRLY